MRLISQNGKFDIPYDEIVIELFDECVVGRLKEYAGRDIVLGSYSTEKKAEKAMDMLRNSYMGIVSMSKSISDTEVKSISEAIRSGFIQPMPIKEPTIECKYFRFPDDGDLEEWHDN